MTLKRFEVWVDGIPASQGSHAIMRGRIVQVNSAKHKTWRKAIIEACHANWPENWQTEKKAVVLVAHFYVPRPKTVTRKLPSVPIDLDKYLRGLGDALTIAGVIEDDSLIVDIIASKRYATIATGAKITVIPLE
jgi:Holliday junction resolvase RusA-like endonuclease